MLLIGKIDYGILPCSRRASRLPTYPHGDPNGRYEWPDFDSNDPTKFLKIPNLVAAKRFGFTVGIDLDYKIP